MSLIDHNTSLNVMIWHVTYHVTRHILSRHPTMRPHYYKVYELSSPCRHHHLYRTARCHLIVKDLSSDLTQMLWKKLSIRLSFCSVLALRSPQLVASRFRSRSRSPQSVASRSVFSFFQSMTFRSAVLLLSSIDGLLLSS